MTAAGTRPKRIRVFLGEDNEADIHLVRRAFRQNALDCDLEVARNGEDALSKLTNPALTPPDLVMLDVNLPRVNGLEVLRAMRRRKDLTDTSVIILTSSDAPRDREEAASLGVRRFIRKASRLDDFLEIGAVVREILDLGHARTPVAPNAEPAAPAAAPPTEAAAPPPPGQWTTPAAEPTPPPTTKRSPPGGRRAPSASSMHPERRGSLAPTPRRWLAIWTVPAVAAAALAIAGLFGHDAIEGAMLSDLRSDLEARVAGTSGALRVWFDARAAAANVIAGSRTIQDGVDAVMREAETRSRDEVSKTAAADALRKDFAPVVTAGAFESFALIARSGDVVLTSEGPENRVEVGRMELPALESVFTGAPRLLHVDAFPESRGAGLRRSVYMTVPVQTAGPHPRAALAMRLPLSLGMLRAVSAAQSGKTGETHVFDRQGRLLTESRFEDDLRRAGLLGPGESSMMRIEARDPGGDLTKGHRTSVPVSARPLTHAVASALSTRGKGSTVEGFRDYRGVEVVAAWEWIPDLDLGVVHKVDSREAFTALRRLRTAFWSVLGAVLASGLLLAAGAALVRRGQVKAVANQVGQYTLDEKIGEGAMGTVYRASHAMLSRPAAVKILDAWEPKAIQRFEREVQLTSRLSHPNTVSIYDFGRTEKGGFYYAMELLDGIDLAELIHITGPLSPARTINILRQVCGSLAEAHAQGLVHRDIKPSNIMLTVRGGEADVVKVVDFGLARLVDSDPSLRLTKDGAIFGTPGFIPPEALCEAGAFDARGDLYALGAVAYELLAGKPPFDRKSNEYLWHCHIEIVPPPPSVRLGRPVPSDLEAVVMRLLAKDPSRRPQSASELRELLDACRECGSWSQSEAQAWWTVHGAAAIAECKQGRVVGEPLPTKREQAAEE
jgi:CheY-like chemotaxis protein